MGFLDRFKKQKEQEVEKKVSAPVAVEKKEEKTTEKAVEKKAETKVKAEKKKSVKTSKKEIPSHLAKILLRPLVTEKTATVTSLGQHVFEVAIDANRRQVAAAISAVYGVKPVKVGIIKMRREPVRFGRHRGMRGAWKKAIVHLPKGKTINVHEGV